MEPSAELLLSGKKQKAGLGSRVEQHSSRVSVVETLQATVVSLETGASFEDDTWPLRSRTNGWRTRWNAFRCVGIERDKCVYIYIYMCK